jgi:hypothetical protein
VNSVGHENGADLEGLGVDYDCDFWKCAVCEVVLILNNWQKSLFYVRCYWPRLEHQHEEMSRISVLLIHLTLCIYSLLLTVFLNKIALHLRC